MSKAFTFEEPGEAAARCPGCGRAGSRVEPATVEALVAPEARAELGSELAFCAAPGCAAGYFDSLGRQVPAAAICGIGYPKRTDPAATACYCFGLTVGEVSPERLAEIRRRLERGEGRCERTHPAGRRCLPGLLRFTRGPYGR